VERGRTRHDSLTVAQDGGAPLDPTPTTKVFDLQMQQVQPNRGGQVDGDPSDGRVRPIERGRE
jgi:hypothetical protein